jgi:hypothetical protein
MFEKLTDLEHDCGLEGITQEEFMRLKKGLFQNQ